MRPHLDANSVYGDIFMLTKKCDDGDDDGDNDDGYY